MSIPKSCSCLKELFAIYPEITAQNYSKPFLPNLHTNKKKGFLKPKKRASSNNPRPNFWPL